MSSFDETRAAFSEAQNLAQESEQAFGQAFDGIGHLLNIVVNLPDVPQAEESVGGQEKLGAKVPSRYRQTMTTTRVLLMRLMKKSMQEKTLGQ